MFADVGGEEWVLSVVEMEVVETDLDEWIPGRVYRFVCMLRRPVVELEQC